MIFAYHSGLHALVVYLVEAGPGVVMLVQVKAIRAAGWSGSPEGFACSLPRSEIRFQAAPPFGQGLRLMPQGDRP